MFRVTVHYETINIKGILHLMTIHLALCSKSTFKIFSRYLVFVVVRCCCLIRATSYLIHFNFNFDLSSFLNLAIFCSFINVLIYSFWLQNRMVSKQIRLTHRKSGLFYSVNFVTEYKLVDEDCNKKPRIQCELKTEQIQFEGNITTSCPGFSRFQ